MLLEITFTNLHPAPLRLLTGDPGEGKEVIDPAWRLIDRLLRLDDNQRMTAEGTR